MRCTGDASGGSAACGGARTERPTDRLTLWRKMRDSRTTCLTSPPLGDDEVVYAAPAAARRLGSGCGGD